MVIIRKTSSTILYLELEAGISIDIENIVGAESDFPLLVDVVAELQIDQRFLEKELDQSGRGTRIDHLTIACCA